MSEARKKILVASHDLSLTGAPRWLINVVTGQRERYDFAVMSPEDGALRAELTALGVSVMIDPKLSYDVAVTMEPLARCDLLLANTLLCHASVLAAARLGKPSIWALHEVESWKSFFDKCQPGSSAAMNLATTVVVACKHASRMYSSWQPRDARVIYYGIEPRPPVPARSNSNGTIRVVLLGTIDIRKGQDIAIAAMKKIGDRGIVLDLIGTVVDAKLCSKLLEESHGFAPIRWMGDVAAEEAMATMIDSDIVIVPSRNDVTPMVIIEAMSLGRPVIAASVGGIPEMIQHGETGMLFENEDSDELARLIVLLADDEKLRRDIGERGRDFIVKHRGMAEFSRQISEVIDDTFRNFTS